MMMNPPMNSQARLISFQAIRDMNTDVSAMMDSGINDRRSQNIKDDTRKQQ